MAAPKAVVQISKIAAAQRQLDAAIRMFFQKEDDLAIHTVTAAAFGVLRGLLKARGQRFTENVFKKGIVAIAKMYVAGTLPDDKKAMLEKSNLIGTIKQIAADGFDDDFLNVNISKAREHDLWLSNATAFLKHADRDSGGHLSADELDNEKMLMATCASYLELMKLPTAEITAYFAFWSAKNDQIDDLAEEVQQFARELQKADDAQRCKLCSNYIQQNRK